MAPAFAVAYSLGGRAAGHRVDFAVGRMVFGVVAIHGKKRSVGHRKTAHESLKCRQTGRADEAAREGRELEAGGGDCRGGRAHERARQPPLPGRMVGVRRPFPGCRTRPPHVMRTSGRTSLRWAKWGNHTLASRPTVIVAPLAVPLVDHAEE
jgi:hypothetical protein